MKAAKIYALAWLIVLTGSGVLFGTGLIIAGMTDPSKIMLPIFAFVVWTLVALGFIAVLPLVLNRLFVPKL